MTEPAPTGEWPVPVDRAPVELLSIPGYEIIEELGRAGMGVVYKARHMALKRLVALKLIRDGALASPEAVARFRTEAEAAARLRHPNVVQIYEIGEHQGRPYFAMEFVAGGSLDKRILGRPQTPSRAAKLIRALALAVQDAHAHNVVHRDLKPANILLQKTDSDGLDDESSQAGDTITANLSSFTPKVGDFGLAKLLDNEGTALTQHGAILGTASYMAPEQAAGTSGGIGPEVDVYGLGAILYELLTGRPPFRGHSFTQTIEQVLHDEPLPPRRINATVPVDLETVCLKCLEKDPARRYATAGQLVDELSRFLSGQPVAAVPLHAAERLARWAARDGYHIIGEIGRGARSTVYHALSGSLKQPVALKVFAAGTCSQGEWDARLRQGADIWAALAHPQIVPVQRGGWWDGAAYLAMEYVPHGSLAARLAAVGRGKVAIEAALRLVGHLTEIVCYLHRQGVVHGNLKPTNVLFAADGIPRLGDIHLTGTFFLSRHPELEDDPSAIGYIAPEQFQDRSASPRLNTDVYGLGLILYELLTGRPAFRSDTTAETMQQVLASDPVPPSQLNPDVSPHLEMFCLRCLRKDQWRRYHRAYDVLTRLRYFQENLNEPSMMDNYRKDAAAKRGDAPCAE